MITTKFDGDIEAAAKQIAEVVSKGEIACFPCNGRYRLIVDFSDGDAINTLIQTKHRIKRTPGLVFIPNSESISKVSSEVSDATLAFAGSYWPGPVTILFEPSTALPKKITKQITSSDGKIGVRVPEDALAQAILKELGRPIFVTSANRQKKGGETSPAQIRKNFANRIALFIDNGDLKGGPSSTIVEIDADGEPTITRQGAVEIES